MCEFWWGSAALPEFGVQDAEEEFLVVEEGESCLLEGLLGGRERLDAEAGEEAKGEVEETDVEGGERAEDGVGGDAEV